MMANIRYHNWEETELSEGGMVYTKVLQTNKRSRKLIVSKLTTEEEWSWEVHKYPCSYRYSLLKRGQDSNERLAMAKAETMARY